AIAVYEQSLAIFRELGDRHGEGQTLGNLGDVYRLQGRWAEATAAYEQSLAIFRELGDRRREEATLNNLETLYQAQREKTEVRGFFVTLRRITQGIFQGLKWR